MPWSFICGGPLVGKKKKVEISHANNAGDASKTGDASKVSDASYRDGSDASRGSEVSNVSWRLGICFGLALNKLVTKKGA